jgi:hypothetical protein
MIDHLISLLEREIAAIDQPLLDGLCPDYMIYREQVAMRKAYLFAVEIARRSVLDEDDDDGLS